MSGPVGGCDFTREKMKKFYRFHIERKLDQVRLDGIFDAILKTISLYIKLTLDKKLLCALIKLLVSITGCLTE